MFELWFSWISFDFDYKMLHYTVKQQQLTDLCGIHEQIRPCMLIITLVGAKTQEVGGHLELARSFLTSESKKLT